MQDIHAVWIALAHGKGNDHLLKGSTSIYETWMSEFI